MPRYNNKDSTRKKGRESSVALDVPSSSSKSKNDCILLLHGNRQTGQLLVGRLEKLRKRILREYQIDMLAPDAPFPHPENSNLRTWWNRNGNDYEGLDETLKLVKQEMSKGNIVGIMGFSQGARLAHLLAMLHASDNWFPSLKFLILVAGYDAPIPDDFPLQASQRIDVPSLHVWGLSDPLIFPEQSEAVLKDYNSPLKHAHEGKHYVPLKSPDMQVYMDFIRQSISKGSSDPPAMATDMSATTKVTESASAVKTPMAPQIPDEESSLMQQDEVQALEAIFPEEVILKSKLSEVDGEPVFDYPIQYEVKLIPTDPDDTNTNWPKHRLTLQVTYPHDYPTCAIPSFKLLHENNITQFPRCRLERFSAILKETAEMETGMPSVLSCIYAVKEYLDSPPDDTEVGYSMVGDNERKSTTEESTPTDDTEEEQVATDGQGTIMRSSAEQIAACTLEGLEIAEQLLMQTAKQLSNSSDPTLITGKGGSYWTYTIGLVGKPSAGKSTFFNAASAFSRQRGDKEGDPEWGGASMAAHPFTTIDPNVGYCLVPSPDGSCPEDNIFGSKEEYGSIHGRDAYGRRFLPVLLKDVAGLVPGAYQGRGRGNQFLNDLTDATVLIHVVDASGTADAQGNTTIADDEEGDLTNPLDDLAWIRNELVEWVFSNLMQKWSSITRKGQAKLSGMFSGYGQNQAMTQSIFVALDNYLEENYGRDRALDDIGSWDQADVHRLVSAFLGVRFPMALALNKLDLPSSRKNAEDIQAALPIHGAHAGTPLEAKSEMTFVRHHLSMKAPENSGGHEKPPHGVWQCLRSAMMLREPILVFPVADMTTYAPLPGMNKNSAEHPSLPSQGMIRCIQAAGGSVPSCWQDDSYVVPSKEKAASMKLRDVLLMKPGSTVDDVFQTLKKYGALGGEFVRAESAGNIGDKAKPIPKHAVVGRESRILKIMSNKRTAWQS